MLLSNKKLFSFIFVIALCVLIPVSCAKQEVVEIPEPLYQEVGTASWYGPGFHGRITANGEIYNQNEMTAAHKKLPFGTKVKVTNLDNDKSIYVRINDRGPYIGKRIIDLSKRAAHELAFLKTGITKVSVEIWEEEKTVASDQLIVKRQSVISEQ